MSNFIFDPNPVSIEDIERANYELKRPRRLSQEENQATSIHTLLTFDIVASIFKHLGLSQEYSYSEARALLLKLYDFGVINIIIMDYGNQQHVVVVGGFRRITAIMSHSAASKEVKS